MGWGEVKNVSGKTSEEATARVPAGDDGGSLGWWQLGLGMDKLEKNT